MWKRSVFVVAALVAASVTVGCGKKSGPKTLKLAHCLEVSHPVHKALTFMAEKVKEKSGGKLIINVFPGGQLGSEGECLEKMQSGTLDIAKVSCASLGGAVDEIKVFTLPYLFRDKEHYWKALESEVGKELMLSGAKKGLRGLGYLDAGARSFYFKDIQVSTVADISGKKIRVMNSKYPLDMISAMGGTATPIDWGELYTSLSTGVVDGAENNPPSFLSSKHYEVCKKYSLDEHAMIPDILVISESVWQGLTEEEQGWLKEAAEETSQHYKPLWDKAEKEALETLEKSGVTITKPDQSSFREAVKPMMDGLDDDVKASVKKIQAVK